MSIYPAFEQEPARLQISCNTKETAVDDICDNHPFNHAVQVVFPSPEPLAAEKITDLDTKYYYYKVTASLLLFLDPDFLQKHVRCGSVSALPTKERIDQDDTFALLPSGILLLSVRKETYEKLGLTGRSAKYGQKGQRFHIHIDLAEPAFKPEGKLYERAKWCFSHTFLKSFDMVISFGHIMTGLSSDISFPENIRAERLVSASSTKIMSGLMLPEIGSEYFEGSATSDSDPKRLAWRERMHELLEWFGLLAFEAPRLDASDSIDPFYAVYSPPEDSSVGTLATTRWTGYITPPQISKIKDLVKEHIAQHNLPWAALMVWGFRDAPISWRGTDHGFHMGGENDYILVFGASGKHLTFQAMGAHDAHGQ
ncbi:ribonuclease P 40kDa subunit-domain-containing protein [Phlyctochytrium arcticum]|nr:ribonuclease P 40kDa subunit-domain-containing protein [Phlyctochytrium arcticum]